jgi:hypothetical protein
VRDARNPRRSAAVSDGWVVPGAMNVPWAWIWMVADCTCLKSTGFGPASTLIEKHELRVNAAMPAVTISAMDRRARLIAVVCGYTDSSWCDGCT